MTNNARVTSAPSQRASTRVAARSVRPDGHPARLPSPDEALAGAAQWIRRHVGAAFFNAAPTISFDPAQNAASQYGVVTGSLNGVDREGDKISYLLTSAPAHGSVIIRPDGTFSYVPTDKFAATGGTDTFMVRADD
ncbi:Ig-like domain-containing protein, partial [Mycolicibacterium gadium]